MSRVVVVWRRLPVKVRAQAARFTRVFTFALVPLLFAGWQTHHLTLAVLGSAATAALETAFRQVVTPAEVRQAVTRVIPAMTTAAPATSNPAAKPSA